MVKQRSQERERQEAVELGRENARLYPQVQNWCRHLQIRMVAAGLLAEWYRLPIGSMEITCEHASARGVQAMQLREVATSFIVNNCRGCPLREGVNIDNIGHVILSEWEEVQQRQHAELEQKNQAKARLYDLVSTNLTEALHQEEITKQSILNLVALLDNQTEHIEAAKKLLQASKIAAELFIDVAIDVICSHFPDSEHGKDCINTIRSLGQKRGQISEVAFIAARRCLADNHHADDVCALIGDYIVQRDFVPEPELVNAIVGIQIYSPTLSINPPEYPGSIYALKEIGKRNIDSLLNSLKSRLSNNGKYTRINALKIIQSLLDTFPELTIKLIKSLIDSLELDDDPYMESADSEACELLAAIYVRYPKETQKALDFGYHKASAEAKALIYEVYRHIVRGASTYGNPIGSKSLYESCIPPIIPLLLQTISAECPVEIKKTVADTLKDISHDHANTLINHFDILLGTLANLAQEEVSLSQKDFKGMLGQIEKQNQELQYSNLVNDVVDALKAVCELNPHLIFNRLKEIIPNLDSTQPHLARYKARLAALYGSLGKQHDLIPEIIPDLYDLLLDFDSVLVRGTAIQAVSEVLQQRADVIPQNMLDLIVTYLNDRFVYVHKSAVHAVRYVHPSSLQEAAEIAWRLILLDQTYEEEPYFRQDILRVLIQIARGYGELLTEVIVPVVIKLSQLTEQNVAENALEEFQRLLPSLPETYQRVFAREVLTFLGRTERPHYNEPRYQLLLALYELPEEMITVNLPILQETARAKVQEEPWITFQMLLLLSYCELHTEAAQLAQEIAVDLPQTKRYKGIVRATQEIGALVKTEALVAQQEVDEALNLLEKAAALEAQHHADQEK